jgi:hypothetical protein
VIFYFPKLSRSAQTARRAVDSSGGHHEECRNGGRQESVTAH